MCCLLQRLLRVERAFPVREAMGGNAENDGINVEMDPEDQFKVCILGGGVFVLLLGDGAASTVCWHIWKGGGRSNAKNDGINIHGPSGPDEGVLGIHVCGGGGRGVHELCLSVREGEGGWGCVAMQKMTPSTWRWIQRTNPRCADTGSATRGCKWGQQQAVGTG
jgi:hypothetical protein